MKPVWDRIFNAAVGEELSDEERELVFRELAAAVADVSKVQASPEHDRITKLIEQKLAQRDLRSTPDASGESHGATGTNL